MLAKVYPIKSCSENLESLLGAFQNHLSTTHALGSIQQYLSRVRHFYNWFNQREVSLLALTTIDLVDYRDYYKTVLAVSTVNASLVAVQIYCRWLVETGRIPERQVQNVRQIPINKLPAPKWLSRTEQAALMRVILSNGNVRDEVIIRLMLQAGLRVAEVARLKQDDFTLSERKGEVKVIGKGGKYRLIPLANDIRQPLGIQLTQRAGKQPLWVTKHSTAITDRAIRKMVAKYAYNAKLEDVSPHTLRHTFCKELLNKGIDLTVVAQLAGHSSIETTRLYVTPGEQELQQAVEKLNWE